MNILENELLVRYDQESQSVMTFRRFNKSNEEMIFTSYSLEDIKGKGFQEMARIIGEDILLALKSVRDEYMKSD